ncbi:hypothetical protein [Sinomicrobium soli]|uniref:hypothetical protein n=1 Tax=Sinomicrobium sp. N-1-3-6 TaxID=2219864 RepID=UPI000DCF18B5|nr:hypothetical protein [Sinomicrobium sp. N-1-3-6]RAV30410.1 hypothetical protein DN748_02580 [Sinomicrobium sp. N-1-3-6]
MKTTFTIYIGILLLSLGLTACSNDDDHNTGMPKTRIGNDAVVFNFENQSFRDSLELQLTFPDSVKEIPENGFWLYLPFYQTSGNQTWYPIPGVREDLQYKVYHQFSPIGETTRQTSLQIKVEEDKSMKPYGKELSYSRLEIIAINPEAIRNLTPEDLNLRDYNEVVRHFDLDQK